jgi:transposase InsO family protein
MAQAQSGGCASAAAINESFTAVMAQIFRMLQKAYSSAESSCWTLRQPPVRLIVHAYPGRPYTRAACQQRITNAGGFLSFSRPCNPYDNAQVEAG